MNVMHVCVFLYYEVSDCCKDIIHLHRLHSHIRKWRNLCSLGYVCSSFLSLKPEHTELIGTKFDTWSLSKVLLGDLILGLCLPVQLLLQSKLHCNFIGPKSVVVMVIAETWKICVLPTQCTLCPLCGFDITVWSRVLFDKLLYLHLVKKFPAFYGTQNFTV